MNPIHMRMGADFTLSMLAEAMVYVEPVKIYTIHVHPTRYQEVTWMLKKQILANGADRIAPYFNVVCDYESIHPWAWKLDDGRTIVWNKGPA